MPDLVRTLLELQREKKWGVVDVDGGGTHTCIYVADGKPVFAEEGTLSDTLGRLLVREGALTQEQYAMILARMTEAVFQAEPMRFGEVAVALGFLTPQQVQESLAAQVQQKVIRCIALPNASFTFRAGRDWAVGRFPSSVEPLVLHAAVGLEPKRLAEILRADAGARARLLEDAEKTGAAFGLGGAELRFVESIDGRRTVRELLATPDVDAESILAALAMCDYVAIVDPSAVIVPAPSDGPSATRGSHADIAVERRKRLVRFTAQRSAAKTADSATARAQAEAALKRVWESRRGTTQEPEKPKSPQEARLLAEAAFQLGVSYLRSSSLARAVQELSRAVELTPGAPEYALYARWAEYAHEHGKLSAEDDAARIVALDVAANRALEQVADLAFAHYVLGQVYMHDGDDDRALRSFKRAVRLDPEMIDAERHVRLLDLRKRRPPVNEPVIEAPPAKPEVDPASLAAVEAVPSVPPEPATAKIDGRPRRSSHPRPPSSPRRSPHPHPRRAREAASCSSRPSVSR